MRTTVTVGPAGAADLDEVVALAVAERRRAVAAQPLLGNGFTTAEQVAPALGTAEQWVARRGGLVVAALCVDRDDRSAVAGPLGVLGDPAALADVYAAAAEGWVADGVVHHVLALHQPSPLHDALVDLGFGHEQAYAVRPLDVDVTPMSVPGLSLRAGTVDDLDAVMELAPLISLHQAGSPVFAPRDAAYFDGLRDQHAEELVGDDARYTLGLLRGRLVAMTVVYDGDVSPTVPEGACELAVCMVAADVRGHGVGLALTAAALQSAREAGFTSMQTDWRTTNLLSSRFWPARGFRRVVVRLVRQVDPTPR